MRMVLLAQTAVLVSWAGAANAATFVHTGERQTFMIAESGAYDIEAIGGSGGASSDGAGGGLGATIGGRVFLFAGTTLEIFVAGAGGGGIGSGAGGGGGGGTFVLFGSVDGDPLIVAGGGGGGAFSVAGRSASGLAPRGNGNGGSASVGGGGAGVDASGGSSGTPISGGGGARPAEGGRGGSGSVLVIGSSVVADPGDGGYGGGGGGGRFNPNGGGGGGGYTGGAGGAGGAAGTSFLTGGAINRTGGTALSVGNGLFTINLVPSTAVPEPATWAMMLGGFGLVGNAMRRRRRISVATA